MLFSRKIRQQLNLTTQYIWKMNYITWIDYKALKIIVEKYDILHILVLIVENIFHGFRGRHTSIQYALYSILHVIERNE